MISNIVNEDIITLCEVLSELEELKVTLRETSKGAIVTGFGALVGGLLAGPIGLAIGGSASAITSAWYSSGKYRPVIDILKNDLTPQQRDKLASSVRNVMQGIRPEDCVKLIPLVMSSPLMKEAVLIEIASFLMKEMSLEVIR